ncbi:alpha-glucosidase [Scenedesmus sp. PABB004]|nr:alpha-glucosidase [Scenedesmus sp. PABB004]
MGRSRCRARVPGLAVFLACCLGAAAGAPRQATYTTTAVDAAADAAGARVATVRVASDPVPEYGTPFEELRVEVTPETATRLHVKVQPNDGSTRWEVPEFIVQRPGAQAGLSAKALTYDVSTGAPGEPFALTVTRASTGEPIFDTRGHRFVFKDQFIELTTTVPADADLYGLGEVSLPTGMLLPRDGSVLTLWARDLASALPYANLYGSHPFYLQVAKDGSTHGVLFLNSNGMDVLLNATSLTYRRASCERGPVIGGLVDLYFFTGPSPEEVIRQYHAVIGAPALPPYWSLGFHQTRWGYSNMTVLESVVDNYTATGLPLETVWSDIEYMPTRFWTMEFDEFRYPADGMRHLVDRLHARGQHWVAIQDAGIAADKGYRAFEEGSRDRVWITDESGVDYMGQVWPGKTVYPDYLDNPRTSAWLTRELRHMHEQVPYDGLWLDMNEASSFCSGLNCVPDTRNITAMHWLQVETPRDYNISELIPFRTSCQMRCEAPPADNTLEHPPYAIANFGQSGQPEDRGAALGWKTISPSAKHANGAREYDAHNLYGTSMAWAHYNSVAEVTGKRPFLLTRSTFPGAGKWTAHWTGDNGVNWENLYMSIAGIVNTNMWGMPMAGADICGFMDTGFAPGAPPLSDAELQELCNRWASLGAFYPFSRNHYAYNTRSHEFYLWDDVAASAKKAYGLRYRLLTYIYGAFYLASAKGGTVARPLLFTDPSDAGARCGGGARAAACARAAAVATRCNASAQWMMGEGLLISPVVAPGATTVTPYFTAGAWYSAWDYSRLSAPAGRAVPLDAPLGEIPVHFRGGAVLPMQGYAPVTRDIRLAPVTLVVALPAEPSRGARAAGAPLPPYAAEESCAAAHAKNAGSLVSCGLLYMDQGDNIQVTPDNSVEVWFTAAAAPDATRGSVTSTVKAAGGEAARTLRVEAVHVLGVAAPAAGAAPTARVGGREVPAEYDAAAGALRISGLDARAGEPLALEWSV